MIELQNKYQELRQENNALEQRLSTLEGNTENTTQPGSRDYLPSSCTEVAGRGGIHNRSLHVIDPDGPGRGVLPMVVQCDLQGQTAITLIGHDSEARTHVNGFEDPGSYSKDVTYWNSMEQMRALVDQSSLCKQLIKYECYGSLIWGTTGRPYSWWVTWDGRQADYWGGASPGSEKCACGETGSCSGRCNCGANDQTWREDSGFLSHKNDLPVTQLRFGDTTDNNGNEEGYYTLGKLICYP
ncbi:PREDICTED: neurexin-4-like [Branchiostoma belcheri]|uniref:Neurexin-4-like n=1 Tax=Branchiostoma belcheri TaxID=7741 RepID=A0A6P5A240_BRABE|nr:PREDICTED: neurexin-4-like [Branchiostoma belcheri]